MPAVPAEISCQDLVELITEYLEDALDASTRARLEAHLEGCAGCTAYLNQMRTTVRLLRAVRPDSFSLETFDRLLDVLRGRSGTS
jgi:anti-sigma factor RsiW